MRQALRDLQKIPGVGEKIAQYFWDIGLKSRAELKQQNPEKLYAKMCLQQGAQLDRCLLYVCRCAVYFAKSKNPVPAKLKWWNWKTPQTR